MARSSKKTTVALTMDLAGARRVWLDRQGLASGLPDLDAVLTRAGHVRALGGVDLYLSVWARVPALSRAEVDAAVDARRAQVIPAARGCIYLVPAEDVPAMLSLAQALFRRRNDRDVVKAGATLEEVDEVAAAALEVLEAQGPLTPHALRAALPDDAVRSLGAAGKKHGMSSLLPTALRHLEFAGRVERRHEGDRLDTERYEWAAAPHATGASLEPAEALRHAAARFFQNAGPATRDDLATWSGAGKRDCAAAIAALDLTPVAVEGYAEVAFVPTADLERVREVSAAPMPESVALLPGQDTFLTLHEAVGCLVDPAHHDQPVRSWGAGPDSTLGQARLIQQRSVIVGDRLAGFWEYDPRSSQVVWSTFDEEKTPVQAAITAQAERLAVRITAELGHGRMFSIDSDEALATRADALR